MLILYWRFCCGIKRDECVIIIMLGCTQFFSLPFLEGRSVSDSVNNIKERLLPVLKANWMLWPIAQAS